MASITRPKSPRRPKTVAQGVFKLGFHCCDKGHGKASREGEGLFGSSSREAKAGPQGRKQEIGTNMEP